MEALPPKTRVPDDWIHPTLRHQLLKRGRLRDTHVQRIEELEQQRGEMEALEHRCKQTISDKRRMLEEIDNYRKRVIVEIEEQEMMISRVQEVHSRLADQLIVQKTLIQQLGPYEMSSVMDQFPVSRCALTTSWTTWGFLTPCFAGTPAATHRFFDLYAPLFSTTDGTWSTQEVRAPVFFNEMCLIAEGRDGCNNPACPYWHQDQLSHVKLSAEKILARAATLSRGNQHQCDAVAMFERFRSAISNSKDLTEAVRTEQDMINVIANLGWTAAFLRDDQLEHNGEGECEAEGGRIAWDAPLLPKVDPNNFQHVRPLLRGEQECSMWDRLLSASSSSSMTVEAVAIFQKEASSLAWRCIMRVAGHTPKHLLWLAERGIEFSPTSPRIRLSHIAAMLRSECKMSDCVDACLQSARILSVQSAMRVLTSSDSIPWCERTARYIAYMVAMTCAHVAPTDPQEAKRLLTEVVEILGKICLLPLAQQNLTLMLVVLQQTGGLEGLNGLPLASISDVTFLLSEYFPCRPHESCANLLSRQLMIIRNCSDAGLSLELMETMRSAIHVSLMRAFSSDMHLVEQILSNYSVYSVEGITELWGDYLRLVWELDGTAALISVARRMLSHCRAPLLFLRVVRCLDFHGVDVESQVKGFVDGFAVSHNISLDCVSNTAQCEKPNVAVVDWVPLLILYARRLPPQQRVELLLQVPASIYCESVNLVLLLWFETVRTSVLLGDDGLFRCCTEYGLLLLREPFLHYFSAIDSEFDNMVAIAHVAGLMLYRSLPVLLGASYHLTAQYRKIVLEVCAELHVVHPHLLMRD
uniref:Uncharacterized protein n=1 Tax=Trypanosoma vivax (strain Y486) TaxID=1055687 RepID=G0TVC2_TRYVY|nr:conserved hypothetical protein [Trypanosoma vivax Y486]